MKSKLYLVRHGQSTYNLENRFRGWKNVVLTNLGISQAKEAATLLKNETFDLAFTSNLLRAQKTLDIILDELNMSLEIIKNEALNERDYGDLVSQNKSEAAEKFGADQVQIWRRSFDTPPPRGESLKMTLERTVPYFNSDKIVVSDRTSGLHVIDFTIENWSDPNIQGDVNNDNTVDILDIMIIVNYIIVGGELGQEQYDLANINNDDVVDILDIIAMVNIILNGG